MQFKLSYQNPLHKQLPRQHPRRLQPQIDLPDLQLKRLLKLKPSKPSNLSKSLNMSTPPIIVKIVHCIQGKQMCDKPW